MKKSKSQINIITSNEGKFREYKRKLSPFYEEVKMLNIEYPEIQTNNLEKVVEYAISDLREHSPLIIDDSGLFIEALQDFPGVYSSFVMDTLGCEGILRLMKEKENRQARFECVIGYLENQDQQPNFFKGISKGSIIPEIKGDKGFGYDPIFKPIGKSKTFAEIDTEKKNEISHRGRALEKLLDFISED